MNNIQSKIEIALTSGATWTLLATFLYNALNANLGVIPPAYSAVVNILLFILTGYLHTAKTQNAAVMGSTRV